MRHPLQLFVLSAAFVLCLGLSAQAGTIAPGTYRAMDHGDGALGAFYGLRADSLGEVFSVSLGTADLKLFWDGGVTASIFGTVNENTAGGAGGVGPTWDVVYNLTGVVAVAQGFTATAGTGTLTDPFLNVINITGKQDGNGFAFLFLADGHRLAGDNDTPVGRGWLEGRDTNDFLFKVPEPGTALLLGAALLGFAASRRR